MRSPTPWRERMLSRSEKEAWLVSRLNVSWCPLGAHLVELAHVRRAVRACSTYQVRSSGAASEDREPSRDWSMLGTIMRPPACCVPSAAAVDTTHVHESSRVSSRVREAPQQSGVNRRWGALRGSGATP
eukprot:6206113-Prymnesium_polylepis.1